MTNEFEVGVPPEVAWGVLTDVERIAPCMPGAELREVEGEEYRGVVKVKVGPITAEYRGKASFLERDETGRRAVLRAEGRETRGQGNANATITATLEPNGAGTRVKVSTDLAITGRVAQFGRGVLADVSTKLLGQFVDCLETTVLTPVSDEVAPAVTSGPSSAVEQPAGAGSPRGVRVVQGPEARPVDLIEVAGGSVARRAAPVLAGVVVLLLLWMLGRRCRR